MTSQSIRFVDEENCFLDVTEAKHGFEFETGDVHDKEDHGGGIHVGIHFDEARERYMFPGLFLRKAEKI